MTSQLDQKIALKVFSLVSLENNFGVNYKTGKSGRAYHWRVHNFKAAEAERYSIPEVALHKK